MYNPMLRSRTLKPFIYPRNDVGITNPRSLNFKHVTFFSFDFLKIRFGHNSIPVSRRGPRVGGNDSNKFPGAPEPLQDNWKMSKTDVL